VKGKIMAGKIMILPPMISPDSETTQTGMNTSLAKKTATLLLALTAALIISCGQPAEQPREAASTPAAAMTADYQPLIGRWARTDGDYMIEIKSITADGKADAGYFNPRPINVARAEASREPDGLRLFLELRDSGYPGCLYKLTFDKAASRLTGTYFQAAQNQTYEVMFEKMK
jgi:hypothetical protein